MVGRVYIQPDHVPDLLDQKRISGQLERLAPVGLQPEAVPEANNSTLAQSNLLGQGSRAPVGRRLRSALPGPGNGLFHLGIGDLARRSRPRLVRQSFPANGIALSISPRCFRSL